VIISFLSALLPSFSELSTNDPPSFFLSPVEKRNLRDGRSLLDLLESFQSASAVLMFKYVLVFETSFSPPLETLPFRGLSFPPFSQVHKTLSLFSISRDAYILAKTYSGSGEEATLS